MLFFCACTPDSVPEDSVADTGPTATGTTDSDSGTETGDSGETAETAETADTDSGHTNTGTDSTRIDDAVLEWSESLDGDVIRVAYAPDGSFVVAAGGSDHGRWDVGGTREVDEGDGEWVDVDVASDSSAYAAAAAEGYAARWTGSTEAELSCGLGDLTALSYDPDGTNLAMGGADGWCVVDEGGEVVLSGDEAVLDLAIAPIRGTLAVLAADGVHAWEIASGESLGAWSLGSTALESGRLSWYLDGDNLAIASPELSSVWLGRVSSSSFADWFSATYANDVAFSPDGDWMAIGFETGTLSTVNAKTGVWQWSWTAHDEGVTSVAFSPDANAMVSGGRPGELRYWSLTYR